MRWHAERNAFGTSILLEVYKQDVWYEHINIYLTYDILGGKSMDFEFRTAGGLFLLSFSPNSDDSSPGHAAWDLGDGGRVPVTRWPRRPRDGLPCVSFFFFSFCQKSLGNLNSEFAGSDQLCARVLAWVAWCCPCLGMQVSSLGDRRSRGLLRSLARASWALRSTPKAAGLLQPHSTKLSPCSWGGRTSSLQRLSGARE